MIRTQTHPNSTSSPLEMILFVSRVSKSPGQPQLAIPPGPQNHKNKDKKKQITSNYILYVEDHCVDHQRNLRDSFRMWSQPQLQHVAAIINQMIRCLSLKAWNAIETMDLSCLRATASPFPDSQGSLEPTDEAPKGLEVLWDSRGTNWTIQRQCYEAPVEGKSLEAGTIRWVTPWTLVAPCGPWSPQGKSCRCSKNICMFW